MKGGPNNRYEFAPAACATCPGHCCTRPGFVLWSEQEWREVGRNLNVDPDKLAKLNKVKPKIVEGLICYVSTPGRCPFLGQKWVVDPVAPEMMKMEVELTGDGAALTKVGYCRIYPCRPRQCRAWPFRWRENVASDEDWNRARDDMPCPGMEERREG